ncbi:hypothetical protein AB834_06965 [PVC group bacterium (ex Bugula neritina AB1)]|nr:hypothetical protein AB834_06965 [PVC group bacterium (ex Bugula neritina AB1)]
MLKRIMAVANQKGGVGKTTSAINVSAALAMAGEKVLFIDIDPQSNGTSGLGVKPKKSAKTLYDVMLYEKMFAEAIVPTELPNLFVLPAEADLFGLDIEMMGREGREFILKKCLKVLGESYNFIVIDCPPSLTLLTVNALTSADSVLVPVQCQYYALEGLSQLLKTIDMCVEGLNPHLAIEGFLLTMYEKDNELATHVVKEVRDHFKDKVFRSVIQRDPYLSEAPGFGKPVTMYQMRSVGAENYIELAQELLGRYSLLEV